MKAIIVDDEQLVCENLEIKLRQIPQITQTAMFINPYDALSYAEQNPIDIAFLDIEMPEVGGMEMARRLTSITPSINIIFVTGHSKYAIDAFKVEASDYLLKPVTIENILGALERLQKYYIQL